jgi:hypothetical protein
VMWGRRLVSTNSRGFVSSLTGLGSIYRALPRTSVLGYRVPPLRGWIILPIEFPQVYFFRCSHDLASHSEMGILELAGAETRRVLRGLNGTTEVVPFTSLLELERFSLLGAKFTTIW